MFKDSNQDPLFWIWIIFVGILLAVFFIRYFFSNLPDSESGFGGGRNNSKPKRRINRMGPRSSMPRSKPGDRIKS